MLPELLHDPRDIGKPDPVARIEGPETLRMEPPVQTPRLPYPHHPPGRLGIQRSAAFPASASAYLSQIGFDFPFHVIIITRL